MDRLKTVLVAVDFSPCSADAFRQAARVAAWTGDGRASLAAMHVVAMPSYMPTPHALLPFDLPMQADFVTEARRQWEQFAPECAAKPAAAFDIEIGSPRERILERVRRDKPDLLVMGSHSSLDAAKNIGATAAACVQGAESKVLLVRKGHAGPFKTVVACIDFTDTSRRALEQAIRVAARDDAALHILHAFDDPWFGEDLPARIGDNMPDFRPQYKRAVEDRLRSFCEPHAHEISALKAVFHCIESEWRVGGYGHSIVALLKRVGGNVPAGDAGDVDRGNLAVLGTRAKWNLRDFFWGTTAEHVIRSAPCSILAIKPAAQGG